MEYKLQRSALYAGILVGAIILLIAALATSVVNQQHAARSLASFHQAHVVVEELYELESLLNRLETEQRGYIVTADAKYLEAYEEAKTEIRAQMALLRSLTATDRQQQDGILELGGMFSVKSSELDRAAETRAQEGFNAAQAIEKSTLGRVVMAEMRERIREMTAAGKQSLHLQQDSLTSSLSRLNSIVIAGGIVAILAAGVGAFMLLIALRGARRAQRLEREKRLAERADLQKSQFLANMSHEIRTPMNAILGFGELLDDLVESPKAKHYVAAIRNAGESLLALINDILDLSKVEAGKVDIRPEKTSVHELAFSLKTLFGHQAEKKGLHLDVDIAGEVPPVVIIDPLRTRQILMNLLSNAVKFTREGSITLRIWTVTPSATASPTPGDNKITLYFAVEDTGPGISKTDRQRIFKPFRQAKIHRDSDIPGTGLGLSICRRLAALMHGSVTMESELGKGSTFILRLTNVAIAPSFSDESPALADESPIHPTDLRPCTILVADDNPTNRELLLEIFRNSEHRVIEAHNGLEALELTLKEKPDIVLMDIRMPVMDGKIAYKAIRTDPSVKDTPVIAVTASSMLAEESQLRDLFDGYIRKPLHQADLLREMAKFVGPSATPPPPRSSDDVPDSDPADASEENVALAARRAIADVKALRQARFPDLRQSMAIGAIKDYGAHLENIGEAHQCSPITLQGQALQSAADELDLVALEDILDRVDRWIADGPEVAAVRERDPSQALGS